MLEEMFYKSDIQTVTIVEIDQDTAKRLSEENIPLNNLIVDSEDDYLLVLPGYHVGVMQYSSLPECLEKAVLNSSYIATVTRDSERWDWLMTDLCQRYSTVGSDAGEDHRSLLKEDRIVADTLLSESMRVDEGEKE